MNLRQPFYHNPPSAYLPFSLSSSVLISSVRQEKVRYVAQCELHRTDLATAVVTDVVTPVRTAPCSLGGTANPGGCQGAAFHLEVVWK